MDNRRISVSICNYETIFEENLPPTSEWYDSFNNKGINQEQLDEYKTIFTRFRCQTLLDL